MQKHCLHKTPKQATYPTPKRRGSGDRGIQTCLRPRASASATWAMCARPLARGRVRHRARGRVGRQQQRQACGMHLRARASGRVRRGAPGKGRRVTASGAAQVPSLHRARLRRAGRSLWGLEAAHAGFIMHWYEKAQKVLAVLAMHTRYQGGAPANGCQRAAASPASGTRA